METDDFAPELPTVHPGSRVVASMAVHRVPVIDTSLPRAHRHRLAKTVLVLADVVTVAVSLVVATALTAWLAGWQADEIRHYAVVATASLPVWPVLFARRRMYAARFVTRLFDEVRRVAGAVVLGALALVVVGWLLDMHVSRAWILAVVAVSMLFMTAERYVARGVFRRRRESGRSLRPVLILGANAEALDVYHSLQDPALGYRVVGFVAAEPDAPDTIDGLPVRHEIGNTVEVARLLGAEGVIMAATSLDLGLSNQLLREVLDDGLHVEVTSALRDVTPERMTVRPLGRHPVVYLEPARRSGWRMGAKRVFDVALSGTLLLLALPLLAASALAIKVTSRGPVLFRQERVGRGGETFQVLKLRTMVVDAEARLQEIIDLNESDGPLFKVERDPRITPVGRWLRKLSIDELPQLWNVLRGDMSLVGPRPALPREVAQWNDELFERLRVRPGITGMWQVSGRSSSAFADYQRLDLFYVDNWSILIDLGIVLRTIPTVLSGRGAC